MNKKQLLQIGVPVDCIGVCIETIRNGRASKSLGKNDAKKSIPEILKTPVNFVNHPVWNDFAKSLVLYSKHILADDEKTPVEFKQWGEDIDDAAVSQLKTACELPMAVAASLMPDAHVGYGLPIGGVLATEGHVIPYAVGVDIACRMRMTILDTKPESLESDFDQYKSALENGTMFGVAKAWRDKKYHPVMDQDWSITKTTSLMKDRAWQQLGTSGSGNHFVEFGVLDLPKDDLGLEKGRYVALLSHSGSRGPGANVCNYYSRIAREKLPKRYLDRFKFLAWLDLDSQEGQEYWLAMNLMGDYAAANHEVIHRTVSKLLGANSLYSIENHHNFAWKEVHGGKEVIVHRKGATPAGKGVLGIIPGSMADPGFVVRGKGNSDSLLSASHGAGRRMSRKEAKKQFIWSAWKKELKERGIRLLSAGLDEMPGAYKSIFEVMDAQQDLVDTIAQFNPKIVKMCDDGSRAED